MAHTNALRGKLLTAFAALPSAAALLCAAPASADATDDAVLAALSNYGITISDRDSALATAHAVCAELDRHQSSSVVAMKVVRDTNLSAKQAGYFVGVSIAAYCPQYKGATDPSVIWLLPQFPFQTTQ